MDWIPYLLVQWSLFVCCFSSGHFQLLKHLNELRREKLLF